MQQFAYAAMGMTLAAALSGPADAAVHDTSENGFSVGEVVHIAAPPDKVYGALVVPSRWWSAAHTFSKNAANLTLDAKAGGCWCETLPDGGTVQHLTVYYAAPGNGLVLRGALGPLQGLGVDGALTIALKGTADGTDLTLTYNVGGYLKDGLAHWAAPVDGVLGEQVDRLKLLVETGSPETRP